MFHDLPSFLDSFSETQMVLLILALSDVTNITFSLDLPQSSLGM